MRVSSRYTRQPDLAYVFGAWKSSLAFAAGLSAANAAFAVQGHRCVMASTSGCHSANTLHTKEGTGAQVPAEPALIFLMHAP